MKSRSRHLPFPTWAALSLPLLALSACTGTEETAPDVRIALLTDGGRTLGYVTSALGSTAPSPLTGTQNLASANGRGVDLAPLNTGRNLALTLTDRIEQRDVNLASAAAFEALPFTPCLTQTAQNIGRDRLFTFSECSGVQQVALYRSDRTLIWWATLPTKPLPIPSNDTPPIRIAVVGDVGVVARPALTGGSEVMRVVPRTSGDPLQDRVAVVSDPVPTQSIRDLAPYGSDIYAATDTGVRPLLPTGVPDATNTPSSVTAFGTGRVDRLWYGLAGSKGLLAAWRDNFSSGNSTEPLRIWDVASAKPAVNTVAIAGLRDLAFDLNGQMYTLSANSLNRYDALLSLQQGYWYGTTLNSSLQDAIALTVLVP